MFQAEKTVVLLLPAGYSLRSLTDDRLGQILFSHWFFS